MVRKRAWIVLVVVVRDCVAAPWPRSYLAAM
jgi:hypothetical protein